MSCVRDGEERSSGDLSVEAGDERSGLAAEDGARGRPEDDAKKKKEQRVTARQV